MILKKNIILLLIIKEFIIKKLYSINLFNKIIKYRKIKFKIF